MAAAAEIGLTCEPTHRALARLEADGRIVMEASLVSLRATYAVHRQNGADSAAVLLRLTEVLGAVLAAERVQARRSALRRHADLETRHAALPRDF